MTETTPRAQTRVRKRIIVCCDGTWQDGPFYAFVLGQQLTNNQEYPQETVKATLTSWFVRIARTINHEDARYNPPIPQIVFYQSGIGSEKGWYSEYIVGTTGATLGDKVEEAYAFIAHNYMPGDEIFLFGFSRGAYTARMVAMFIGLIGVLDRTDMDHFAGIFLACQKLGKTKDDTEKRTLKTQLHSWTGENSPGKNRTKAPDDNFSVKFVGVFETVGSLGLPQELTHRPGIQNVFGFNDRLLGEHIQYAYQALALNEPRADFDCCKFEQTSLAAQRGQTLSQCWFSGCHADVGGGYRNHDLADITLFWMAANVGDHLSLDYKYLGSLPQPAYPYGEQPPHDPRTGIFALSHKLQRKIPTQTNNVTHETIHASVLQQRTLSEVVDVDIVTHSHLVPPLLPLEDALRKHWASLGPPNSDDTASLQQHVKHIVTHTNTGLATESGQRIHENNWLGRLLHEVTNKLDY
ncbi:DUF2235 domain-containing protein [Mycena indigotica]|uniref:DUF2235 domain-containing protein n=1 Tax=Mycena indigotica TaxID=2126181 RepID=A0A8H6SVE6_9AGAR|nr:DUF2235 domain-containing protein [Mycena indigotica]KAF7306890.1 DUF2235 domain-containing protein [Mycena indigotica]